MGGLSVENARRFRLGIEAASLFAAAISFDPVRAL
jgi:hypothetical protein